MQTCLKHNSCCASSAEESTGLSTKGCCYTVRCQSFWGSGLPAAITIMPTAQVA